MLAGSIATLRSNEMVRTPPATEGWTCAGADNENTMRPKPFAADVLTESAGAATAAETSHTAAANTPATGQTDFAHMRVMFGQSLLTSRKPCAPAIFGRFVKQSYCPALGPVAPDTAWAGAGAAAVGGAVSAAADDTGAPAGGVDPAGGAPATDACCCCAGAFAC